MRSLLLTAFVVVALVASASAQTSYPMLMSLKPVAVQAGTTAECEVGSRYTLLGTHQVFFSGEGLSAEVVAPEMPEVKPGEKPKEVTKLKLKITATSDAQPGVREFRLATPTGASTVGQIVVVRDPVVVEQKDNDSREKAQEFAAPATLCGAIEKNEDFDFWKFHAEAGQSLSFHVRAQRLEDKIHDLQNHVDPILFLRDATGGVVAMSDNAFFADPFIAYTFQAAGDYFLEIRDVRYQGNQYWEYCIEVASRPFVTQVFPMALKPGAEKEVALSGWLLSISPPAKGGPGGVDASVSAEAARTPPNPLSERGGEAVKAMLVAPNELGVRQVALAIGDQQTLPVPVFVTDLPQVVEAADDNDAIASAVAVTSPVVISGRIEKASDVDVYSFPAKKGEKYNFEVLARRHQSNLDSYLRILNDKGQVLREEDDLRQGRMSHADTWIEGWDVPSDGTFFVEIRDTHLRGGDGFGYVLQITPATPTFELQLDTDKTQLTPGTHGVLFAKAVRKHGFTGEIELHVDGLPPGVTATCGRILNSKNSDGAIVLSAAPDAQLTASNIRVWGTATHPQGEGQPPLELKAEAVPYQETYNPGGGRVHWPVENHMVCVGAPSDIRGIELSETDIHLKPGESKKIAVKVQRSPDYKGNITLDLTFNHLERIYASSLPDGITIEGGQSKTLLAGGASEGFITISADKNATPVEKQLACVMANISINFVMKATYASQPVYLTIEQP